MNVFCMFFYFLIFFFKPGWQWNGRYITAYFYIKNHMPEYQHAQIYMYPTDSTVIGIIPLLRKYNFDFYDSHGNSYSSQNAYIEQWNDTEIYFDNIEKQIDKLSKNFPNKKYFLFISTATPHQSKIEDFWKLYKNSKTKLNFKKHAETLYLTIYEITK